MWNMKRTSTFYLKALKTQLVYVVGALLVGGVVVQLNDETEILWSEALFALTCFGNMQ
jgi:hypothetical protein